MKITKSKLKQIIKEELKSVLNETEEDEMEWEPQPPPWAVRGPGEMEFGDAEPPDVVDSPRPGVSLDALWRDLSALLEKWPDDEHPYYMDLYNLMEDYSTSPDRPTRLPGGSEEPGIELPAVTGASHQRMRMSARRGKHGIPPHE